MGHLRSKLPWYRMAFIGQTTTAVPAPKASSSYWFVFVCVRLGVVCWKDGGRKMWAATSCTPLLKTHKHPHMYAYIHTHIHPSTTMVSVNAPAPPDGPPPPLSCGWAVRPRRTLPTAAPAPGCSGGSRLNCRGGQCDEGGGENGWLCAHTEEGEKARYQVNMTKSRRLHIYTRVHTHNAPGSTSPLCSGGVTSSSFPVSSVDLSSIPLV